MNLPSDQMPVSQSHRQAQSQTSLFVVFVLLSLGIGLVDYFFYRAQSEAVKVEAQRQLSAIADLKVQQIANWRNERLSSARLVRDHILLESALADWFKQGFGPGQKTQAVGWLQSFVRNFDFRDALLLGPTGEVLAATRDALPVLEPTRALMRSADEKHAPLLSNLQISLGTDSYMDLVVPLQYDSDRPLLGFVVFRIDPQRFLFPLIQSWPLPSESAETLLVEARGDSVLFLNEMRHRRGTALRLTLPRDQPRSPAAVAVLGETLVMEGRDYRGAEVLAAMRPVPDTPWSMVAKVDMHEVMAPLHGRFSFVFMLSVLMLLGAGTLSLYLWRLQRRTFRQQRETDRDAARKLEAANERLVAAQRIARVGSWERTLDGESTWWSDEACRLFDFAPDEAEPTLAFFYARIHPEDRERVQAGIVDSPLQRSPHRISFRALLPSGEIRHFENTSRIVSDDNGTPVTVAWTLQDVTEQKRIRDKLRKQTTQLELILESMPQGVCVCDEQLRVLQWNPRYAEMLSLPTDVLFQGALFYDVLLFRARRGEYGPGDPETLAGNRVELARRFETHRVEHSRPNGQTHLIQGVPYYLDGNLAGFVTTYTDISDSKRAEVELQHQHTLLRTIIENIPGGVSLIDRDLNFIAINDELKRILDFPDALFSHASPSLEAVALFNAKRGEYGPGDPHEIVAELIEKARNPTPHLFERTRPDGTTIEVRGTPLPDGGFVTIYTDVTQRKRAELALKTLSERLTLATSAASIGIWDWRPDSDTLVWDKRMYELFGIDPNNSGEGHRNWLHQVYPDDRHAIKAILRTCYTSALEHFELDFRIVCPDGQIRYLNTRIRVERDTDRRLLRVVGANMDITARKLSEEHLLLAEKVFASSSDAIMITDQQNRIVSVNEAFTKITGYLPQEALGEDPRILASGRHDAAFYRSMWEQLRDHGHWSGEIWDRRKDGEIYPKWMTINAVTDQHSGKLTHYVTMFADITERKSAETRIHHLAHHDVLTGLPNRFSLEDRIDQACAEARRHSWNVAVFFIDLDRFKVINDTLGHHVGDQLLIQVAQRFSRSVRESDTVARLGGDEFVIILPDLNSPADAASVANKIIEALNAPIVIDTHELHTSPSIGISLYPGDGQDSDTVMRNADTAMYHAKSLGRNNFQFYSEEMNRSAVERLDTERRLRHALEHDEFELHYQPQLATRDSRIVGVETLLRWTLSDGRRISPAHFIPIAEETGLIVAIGEWVLRTACRQIKAWLDAGLPPLRLAVNVSARQLRKRDFPEIVAGTLADSGLPAHLLEIEITESAVMENPEDARHILQKLKNMGVTLAIDDFGTGYSSLAYLKLFPIDHLKIDRSFVTDIEHDANDAAIAISTIALAHSLGLKVIAEGVETEAQLDLLREHGCDELQGYLFSRPLAAAEALEFLMRAAKQPARAQPRSGPHSPR